MLYNQRRRCWRIRVGRDAAPSGAITSVLKPGGTGVATVAIIAVLDGQAPVASQRSC